MAPEVDAQQAVRTHFCKQPGCTNEARGTIGRNAYCTEHQESAPRRGPRPAPAGSMAKRLAELQKLAKEADRWQARAETLARDAQSAIRVAAEKRREFARAVAVLQTPEDG